MTAHRDPDRLINAFLEDGVNELSDRAYDAVRSEIEHTRQRVVIGPWRLPRVNNYAGIALAAAAVLIVAVVGVSLLPGGGLMGGRGPGATAAATAAPPTPIAPASPALPLPSEGALAPGTYVIDDDGEWTGSRITFSVPEGWTTDQDIFIAKHRDEPREALFTPWLVTHVFTDSCQWDESEVVHVQTVDEIVEALGQQSGRTASEPNSVTVGGFPGMRIQLSVPAELDVGTCTNGNQRYWPGAGIRRPDFSAGLCCNPAGNTDTIYVVDLPAHPIVIVARHYPETSPADRAELEAIIESLQIAP